MASVSEGSAFTDEPQLYLEVFMKAKILMIVLCVSFFSSVVRAEDCSKSDVVLRAVKLHRSAATALVQEYFSKGLTKESIGFLGEIFYRETTILIRCKDDPDFINKNTVLTKSNSNFLLDEKTAPAVIYMWLLDDPSSLDIEEEKVAVEIKK
jgi:hypothetical protein